MLSSCANSPTKRFQEIALQYSFVESTINGHGFDHAIFAKPASESNEANTSPFHIYIEGDGHPFFNNRYINADPTSTRGLMLKLMQLDSAKTALVGRPCYHSRKSDECKNSQWWTSHRYGTKVITSMAAAIENLNTERRPIILIGYSGGGALASLLATKVKKVQQVLTINANLDIDAWTNTHAYTPLTGSLNPIEHISQTIHIPQLHLIGKGDRNIPYESWAPKLSSYGADILIYDDIDHKCCWEAIWPDILKQHVTSN